jgi:hypothetical protein
MVGSEDNVWIPIAFENVVVHSPVSRFATAIAALGIDQDFAEAFAGREIIMNISMLELERAVDGVKNVTQGELDVCLSRVQLEDRLLSKQRRSRGQKDQYG